MSEQKPAWPQNITILQGPKNKELLSVMNTQYVINGPLREKNNNLNFRPGPTQTGLYCHRRWLEAGKFGYRK